MEITREAPKTLSGAVRLAVECGRDLDRDVYFPNAAVWHRQILDGELDEFPNPQCFVCDGGAILAGAVGLAPTYKGSALKSEVPHEWMRVVWAVDAVRVGNYKAAVDSLYGAAHVEPVKNSVKNIDIPDNADFFGWPEFIRHLDSLEVIAAALQRVGL